jgi:hypothetical protein
MKIVFSIVGIFFLFLGFNALSSTESMAKLSPGQCCTYKEWTYYADSSHSVPIGSRTRFCCGNTYSQGQETQYCDWFVSGCPFDPSTCPDGVLEIGNSNNCQN